MWKLIAASSLLLFLAYWLVPRDDQLHIIKGKRVLITGASMGIGEEIAYQFAKLGASTVITARRQQVLEKVAEKCKSLGPSDATHTAISADMFDLKSISNLVEKSVKQLGGLDIVVLNHVGTYQAAFFDGDKKSRDFIHSAIDLNFKSYVEMTGLALPHLTNTQGRFIILNSVAGIVPIPMMAAYAASKFALRGFFSSLGSQFIMENRNVSITSCFLGAIDTYNAQNFHIEANLTRLQKYLDPVPVDDTALAVISASARREDTMYYPLSIRVQIFIYRFIPSLFDCLVRELYRY